MKVRWREGLKVVERLEKSKKYRFFIGVNCFS